VRETSTTTTVFTALTPGQHLPMEVIAIAADGTTTTPLRAEVAPAPKVLAPEGDISTDFCGANAFLKQGTAEIPCALFSVMLGHVRTRDGIGVPGMRVSALGHPEWGSTTSQADGLYALAVAAGRHTLRLEASAFISLQRTVTAPARNFAYVPDTAVLRRDEKATLVRMGAGGFHTATPQEDKDGKRTTSLFVPPSTEAFLRFADGGLQPAASLTLRTTEATVGPMGQASMPATLPPATAYTFAAEVSADEALAAGAAGISFSGPVAVYADNFLKFPVGAPIPLGIYDEAKGLWESGSNAAVIAVTANGGVDYTGDGLEDADFPLLQGEKAALAAHFAAGTQLVRSQTLHFSTFDTNPCWRCVGSCEENGEASASNNVSCPTCMEGSLIRVQNRSLSEYAPVAGTGFSLGWHSNRGNVRQPAADMKLGLLSDGGAPEDILGTYFRLEVAGRTYVEEDAAGGVGKTARIAWDGKDAFGRTVRGPVAATASTGYGFGAVSVSGSSGGPTLVIQYNQPGFGVWPPPGAREFAATRDALFFLKHTSLSLGDWAPRENLGNLSLDVVHGYSEDGTLHLGDGSEVSAFEGGPMVRFLAGGGTDTSEDAGFGTVDVGSSPVLAEGPEGVYFIEEETRVRLLRTDGGVVTIAGDAERGFAGDGLPATQGRFNYARILEVDSAGNLSIGDIENHRIRRIDAKTGLLSTVVGNGMSGFSPDGTRATEASLDGLSDILVGHDGHLYFMAADDVSGALLRRVEERGTLTTVAGGNTDSQPP